MQQTDRSASLAPARLGIRVPLGLTLLAPLGLAFLAAAILAGCSDSTSPSSNDRGDDLATEMRLDPGGSPDVLQRVGACDPLARPVQVDLIGSNLASDPAEETLSIDVALRNASSEPLAGPVIVWIGRLRPEGAAPRNADLVDSSAVAGDFRFGYDYSTLLGDDLVLASGETTPAKRWIFHDPDLAPLVFAAGIEAGSPQAGPRISGLVFVDLDCDGLPGEGEPPVPGGILSLSRPDGGSEWTPVDRAGRYSFAVESAGLYSVAYHGPEGMPAPRLTTPNPLRIILAAGPDGIPVSMEEAHFGLAPRPQPEAIPPCVMTERPLDAIAQHHFRILDAHLRGEILVARVQYSGCNPGHPFTLYVSTNFRESYPVQTSALLVHEIEEPCDAVFEQVVRFDLAPLRRAYLAAYGGSGEIVVHLRDAVGGEVRLLFVVA